MSYQNHYHTPRRYVSYDGELLFGQHRGERLSHVDTGYLGWCLETINGLSRAERSQIDLELIAREMMGGGPSGSGYQSKNNYHRAYDQTPTPPRLPAGVTPQTIREVISAGRQHLTKRYHPDLGGDAQKMLLINVTADYLEAQAETVGAAG